MQKKDRGIQLQEYRGKKKNGYKKKDMLWSLPACPDLFVKRTERFRTSDHGSDQEPAAQCTQTSGKTCKYSCPTGTFRLCAATP